MTTSAQPSSGDTGAANPVRLDLTAWRLIDGRLLVTPHGAPAAIMDAPDFTPAKFEEPKLLPPAPRKALPAPREAKVKKARKTVKKAAVAAPRKAKTAPDEDRQRRLVEAKGIRAAAEELGVAYQTLWARARARGWTPKRVGTGGPKRAEAVKRVAVAAPEPKRSAPSTLIPENTTTRAARPGVHMTVPRRCDDCGARTDEDPCHACKAPWKRTR